MAELAEAIGFIEVAAETEFEEAASESGIVVAAGRDDACIGVELFQRVITRFAAHAADDASYQALRDWLASSEAEVGSLPAGQHLGAKENG